MNSYNPILIFMLILISTSACRGQITESPKSKTYSGNIMLEEDQRIFSIEIKNSEDIKILWSINNSGRHRIPIIDLKYDENNNSFVGNLTFFGKEKFGKIDAEIVNDSIIGKLIWHHDTLNISLIQSNKELPYSEEEITFKSHDNYNLKGTLILPLKEKNNFPLIIFTHGSGYFNRWWGMYWAKEFSKIGISSFLYDKRGCGDSEGNWVNASLDDLAKDLVYAKKHFENHSKIDNKKIGFYGVSQGGWVISRACALSKNTSFIIVNSGGGISPYEEELYSYDINLQFAGIKQNERMEALELVENYMEYLKTGKNRNELLEKMKSTKSKNWYKYLGLENVMVSDKNRKNWEWVATYKPKKDIKNIKIPVLLLFGAKDHVQPTEISIKKWEEALDQGKNKNFQIKTFKDAGHGLLIGGHHVKGFPKYAKGHLELMKNWLSNKML